MSDVYEPGSVEKVLTLSALIDAGKVTAAHPARGPGRSCTARTGSIHDWFPHGTDPPDPRRRHREVLQHRHRAGRRQVRARPAARTTSTRFGLGQRTDIGVRGETPGILPTAASGPTRSRTASPSASRSRSTPCRWPRRSTRSPTAACGSRPSLIQGSRDAPTTGQVVGTDTTTTRRVVSAKAARADHAHDGAGRRPRGRGRARRRGARLPRRRQDRHRAARRRRRAAATTAPSRSPSPGFAPGRRPPLHGLRRRPEPRATAAAAARSPARRSRRS